MDITSAPRVSSQRSTTSTSPTPSKASRPSFHRQGRRLRPQGRRRLQARQLRHREQDRNATLDLQKAQSDLTSAREQKEIQESTNSANLEAANVDLILARLDLQQYVEGTYPVDLQAGQTNVEMAKIMVKNKEDDMAQTRSLFSKGFVTAADVKTAELELLKAKNDLDIKTTALQVLEKYTHEKDLTDKKNKVARRRRSWRARSARTPATSPRSWPRLQQYEQSLALRKQQYEHRQEQLAACTIKAPAGRHGRLRQRRAVGRARHADPGGRAIPLAGAAHPPSRHQLDEGRLPDQRAAGPAAASRPGQADPRDGEDQRADPAMGACLSNISIMPDSSQRWFTDSKDYRSM
jgi:hypothetical protein